MCACKGRREGRHDLLCEGILTEAFGSVGDAPQDVLNLMQDRGRIIPGTLVKGEITEGGEVPMSDNEGPWAVVSSLYKKDLDLVAEAALRGDDSATPAGSIREAAERVGLIIDALAQLDYVNDGNAAAGAVDAVLFYIGYRAGRVTAATGIPVRGKDIKIPASHVIALIAGSMTMDQVIAEVDEELPS